MADIEVQEVALSTISLFSIASLQRGRAAVFSHAESVDCGIKAIPPKPSRMKAAATFSY
jgi:hypothetical protein